MVVGKAGKMLIGAYLIAICAANLAVARWGVAAEIPAAFVLIAFDLTVRDALHERWRGRHLWLRMAALIGSGSALSYLLNRESASIALASCVAFGAASVGDALAFHLIPGSWLRRVNGSNLVGAALDSLLFPTLAFGVWMPLVVLGQFMAKVVGGGIWSLVLETRNALQCDITEDEASWT
jgi:hypothetical protein